MNAARFQILSATPGDDWKGPARALVIRDLGPWSDRATVTNDAERVVARLVAEKFLAPDGQLVYIDSDGRTDELLVVNGAFAGFAPVRVYPMTVPARQVWGHCVEFA